MSPSDQKDTDCQEIYDKFTNVIDWAGKVDVLLVGGESCDGWNPIEHGEDRTATEKRQIEIAVKALKLVKGSPKIYCLNGSRYHRGSMDLDEQVAHEVKAATHPHYRSQAPHIWDVKIEDTNFNFAHHISVSKSTWQYQTTPIAREEVLAILNDNPAQIVLRFHAHYFVYAGYTSHLGMVCPGYETKTPYQAQISPLGEYAIGSVLFDVDGNEWDWHQKIWKTKPSVVKA